MALKRITSNYECVGFSEIDKYAIKSYRAIHGDDIKAYGDITKMKEIPECDIFTWSFPCTDLSKAGKQAGMTSGTRSGLVYEVLRLVRDSKHKPKVLIMENVIDLIQVKFVRQFGEIQLELERMGYMNYVEVLNAKEHGVAQNRERVFMVSILGDYSYSFPRMEKLEKRLKDYLEDNVDEKYYLNEKQIKDIQPFGSYYTWEDKKGNVNTQCNRAVDEDGYALTIAVAQQGMVLENNLRIRKLTPLECWRLMDISDDDFYKAKHSGVSDSQLYKQAGNGIVVRVFEKILREMIK